MRILIINDYYVSGGTEVQCLNEKDILEKKNDECYIITFDNKFAKTNDKYWINIPLKNKNIYKFYNKIFFNYFLYKKLRKIIEKIKPDMIHINNLHLSPIAQYKSLKDYNVIRTLRDYSVICPKLTCIYNDYSVCMGSKRNNCCDICMRGSIEFKLKIKKFNKLELLNRKYVNSFITPSEKLRKLAMENGYSNVYCINDCLSISEKLNLNEEIKFKNKKYLYFGAINENKGVYKFIECFNEYCEKNNKNLELNIIGNGSKSDIDKLNKLIKNNNKIKYIGFLEHSKVIRFLEQIYCVVVPSLWIENYPNTVLEAMLTRCIVIGSNRGGIPEMIKNSGIMFDIMNSQSVINAIDESFKLSFYDYKEKVKKGIEYIYNHNSEEVYYTKLNSILKRQD